MVGVTIMRKVFSTIFIFALSPFVARIGLLNVLVTLLVLATTPLLFVGVFIMCGKKFRGMTAKRYQDISRTQSTATFSLRGAEYSHSQISSVRDSRKRRTEESKD